MSDTEELNLLKTRAKQMGIKFHPATGLEKMRLKVAAAMADKPQEADNIADPIVELETPTTSPITITAAVAGPESKAQKYNRLRKEAGVLIRVVVANLNPNKKEWEGEVFTVSNSVVGTYKKYVPFNIEEGWHVPHIIYQHMLEKTCQIFITVKGPKGAKVRKSKIIKELNVVVLPALTGKELADLAQRQAMAHNLGDEDERA